VDVEGLVRIYRTDELEVAALQGLGPPGRRAGVARPPVRRSPGRPRAAPPARL